MKNINCTIAESLGTITGVFLIFILLDRFEKVVDVALKNNIKVRGYVSTVIACPYSGLVDKEKVVQVSKALLDMGCYEISLGDTIGVGNPNQFKALLDDLLPIIPVEKVAI